MQFVLLSQIIWGVTFVHFHSGRLLAQVRSQSSWVSVYDLSESFPWQNLHCKEILPIFKIRRDANIYLFVMETLTWINEIFCVHTSLEIQENKGLFSINQSVQGVGRGKYLQSCENCSSVLPFIW